MFGDVGNAFFTNWHISVIDWPSLSFYLDPEYPRLEPLACIHPNPPHAACLQVGLIQRLGKVADQDGTATGAEYVSAAGVYQVDVEYQNVARCTGKLFGVRLVVAVEWWLARLWAMAPRDDAGGAVTGAVIVEVDHGVGDIARALRREITVQLLMTTACQWLAAFHQGEEEALTDQFANHCQQLWQA